MLSAIFHPKAREAFRSFSREIRFALGDAISDLQHGEALGMPLARPMPSVGSGVFELRAKDRSGTYRAFYVVNSARGVLVFHAFEKRTQKTPRHEIELGQARLREML
jgi:phage-related protein